MVRTKTVYDGTLSSPTDRSVSREETIHITIPCAKIASFQMLERPPGSLFKFPRAGEFKITGLKSGSKALRFSIHGGNSPSFL
jgi:hypothetical protein